MEHYGRVDRTYWLRDAARIVTMGVEQTLEFDDVIKGVWYRHDTTQERQCLTLEEAWRKTIPSNA
jgi:hypothetical protein